MQLAHALNGIGLRVVCVRLEVRSGGCLLQREASGLALHPSVKGYCRPDLPAHYRETTHVPPSVLMLDLERALAVLGERESAKRVAQWLSEGA